MKVLVTGGAGYIGSHACKALSLAGHVPVAFDNLSTGHAYAAKWGPLEIGDIADRESVVAAISRHSCTAVMHFAAHAYVRESVSQPLKYYGNNVAGSVALLEAARLVGIDKVVFSSSCAVYGVPDELPITESSPRQPVNPYGRSKLMVEQILEDAVAAYGMAATALRYFNAAGADQDGEIGETHRPETHLIPLILQTALGAATPVRVFGTDFPTPDGTCVRDYVHVSDLADAHVLALEALEGQTGFAAYNLGTGTGWSVKEVIEAARRLTNKRIEVLDGMRRAGEPPELVADPSKARRELGWTARNSQIDTILSSAMAWEIKTWSPDG